MISRPDPTRCCCGGNNSDAPTCQNHCGACRTSSDAGGAVAGLIVLGLAGLFIAGLTSSASREARERPLPFKLADAKLPPGKPLPLDEEVEQEEDGPDEAPSSSSVGTTGRTDLLLGVIAAELFAITLVFAFYVDGPKKEPPRSAPPPPAASAPPPAPKVEINPFELVRLLAH